MKYLAFLPGYVVPPLVAMVFVYAFTRLLTPAEYGAYAVIISIVQLVLATAFSWLQLSVKRYYAEASEGGWLGALTLTVYVGYAASAVAATVVFLVVLKLSGGAVGHSMAYAAGVGLVLARASSVITKAYRVGGLRGWRYSAMEAAESLIGLAAGLVFVAVLDLGAVGVMLGGAVGALMPAIIDLRALIARLKGARWDPAIVAKLLRFGAPLTAGDALEYVMASSDRLLVVHYLGQAAVGTYAVAYTLADRGVSVAFQALGLITYPVLMRALAAGGRDAARDQARRSFEIIIALGLPAFIGFVMATPQIAALMIGSAFSAEALEIMPLIAAGVFMANFRLHYVDHVFHVTQRTDLAFYAAIAPAILNVVLNVILLPRIGVMGAVISTVAAYAVALVVDGIVARKLFPLPLPPLALAKTCGATAAMAIVLHVIAFPTTIWGLVALVAIGGGVYAGAAVLLDICGSRAWLMRRVGTQRA